MHRVLALISILLPLPALAHSPSFSRPPTAPSELAQHSGPCQCRALGRMYDMGSEVCLDLGDGKRTYSCDMDQNVTNWKKTGRTCPES